MKLSDFTIDSLPDGKHLVVWFNNVNHFQLNTEDYFITFVIRDLRTGQNAIIYRNVKESLGISLGSIIYNKRVTDNVIGDVFTSIINVPEENKTYLMSKENTEFYTNEKYFLFSEKIQLTKHTYGLLKRSQEQHIVEYTDLDENVIIFPSYVIAQYYYYRSSSMSKQVMAHYTTNETALEGLYKSISRDEEGNASIVLKPNAKSRDGAEIFRFAIDEYANYNFHRVFKDLIRSKNEIKAAFKKLNIPYKHNTASLSALFPFYGEVYMKYRGIKLSDGRILALEILAENSKYPFQKLTIYKQSKRIGAKPVKIGSYQGTLDSKKSDKINDKTPSNIFTPIEIYSELKVDGRMDLKGKKIKHDILNSHEELEEIQNNDQVNYETDASFTEPESGGDINTANAEVEMSTFEKPDGWDEKERVDLEAFLVMLDQAKTEAEKKGRRFNYFVNDEQMLPQKPKRDKGRELWAKSVLIDNKTPRAYSSAFIEYDGKHVCVIDIERDHRVKGLSVLVLKMNNNTQVSDSLIKNILINFVKEKGSWLQGIDTFSFKNKRLNHPEEITNDSIKNWAKRLLNSIKGI